MKPTYKNIIVEKLTKGKLGKIVMPDVVQDDWFRGKVISVGPKVEEDINEGDIVIFPPPPPHLGDYPVIGDDGYIIISENMILAIED